MLLFVHNAHLKKGRRGGGLLEKNKETVDLYLLKDDL